jgi:prophage DNA circulation protein
MNWFDQLQQASYRGVPFGVLGSDGRFGRRVAVHEYPMRDKPYIEDMGRSTRRINLVGFLVENSLVYGGGSVLAQRDAMVAAAEQEGAATLVHPTLGRLTVSIPDGCLNVRERWDQGRYFELSFSFIESGGRIFPSSTPATQSLLGALADSLGVSAAIDFVSTLTKSINLGLGLVEGVINLGNSVVAAVVDAAAGVAEIAGRAARDATNLSHLASLLTGNYGRYANGATSSAFQASGQSNGLPTTTIDQLIGQATTNRQAVDRAGASLQAKAASLDASTAADFVVAAQSLVTALVAAIANPADGIRLLQPLVSYAPIVYAASGQLGQAKQIVMDASSAAVRRCALAGLAQIVATYVPSSYDDAAVVRSTVLGLLDDEILIAGDAGDDSSYGALRALRQGIAADMAARGADLARLQAFSYRQPMPSLVLAQRIYQDPTRSDQLVAQANPIHPAFMPLNFRALSQ